MQHEDTPSPPSPYYRPTTLHETPPSASTGRDPDKGIYQTFYINSHRIHVLIRPSCAACDIRHQREVHIGLRKAERGEVGPETVPKLQAELQNIRCNKPDQPCPFADQEQLPLNDRLIRLRRTEFFMEGMDHQSDWAGYHIYQAGKEVLYNMAPFVEDQVGGVGGNSPAGYVPIHSILFPTEHFLEMKTADGEASFIPMEGMAPSSPDLLGVCTRIDPSSLSVDRTLPRWSSFNVYMIPWTAGSARQTLVMDVLTNSGQRAVFWALNLRYWGPNLAFHNAGLFMSWKYREAGILREEESDQPTKVVGYVIDDENGDILGGIA